MNSLWQYVYVTYITDAALSRWGGGAYKCAVQVCLCVCVRGVEGYTSFSVKRLRSLLAPITNKSSSSGLEQERTHEASSECLSVYVCCLCMSLKGVCTQPRRACLYACIYIYPWRPIRLGVREVNKHINKPHMQITVVF